MILQMRIEDIDMTEVEHIGDRHCYIAQYLKNNLDAMKQDVKKDDDVLIIIDGKEGSGKSCLAQAVGWYLADGIVKPENVCMTPQAFKAAVSNAKQYDVVIFDEAYMGYASTDSMMTYNRILKKMLVLVRQKNLFLILVLPSVFDLNKYCVLHRADAMMHTFKHKGQRGHFAFYNDNKIKSLYLLGKKMYSYYSPKPNFAAKFTKFYAIDEAKYRELKLETMNSFLTKEDDDSVGRKTAMLYVAIKKLFEVLNDNRRTTRISIGQMIGCDTSTVDRALAWQIPDGWFKAKSQDTEVSGVRTSDETEEEEEIDVIIDDRIPELVSSSTGNQGGLLVSCGLPEPKKKNWEAEYKEYLKND